MEGLIESMAVLGVALSGVVVLPWRQLWAP